MLLERFVCALAPPSSHSIRRLSIECFCCTRVVTADNCEFRWALHLFFRIDFDVKQTSLSKWAFCFVFIFNIFDFRILGTHRKLAFLQNIVIVYTELREFLGIDRDSAAVHIAQPTTVYYTSIVQHTSNFTWRNEYDGQMLIIQRQP